MCPDPVVPEGADVPPVAGERTEARLRERVAADFEQTLHDAYVEEATAAEAHGWEDGVEQRNRMLRKWVVNLVVQYVQESLEEERDRLAAALTKIESGTRAGGTVEAMDHPPLARTVINSLAREALLLPTTQVQRMAREALASLEGGNDG